MPTFGWILLVVCVVAVVIAVAALTRRNGSHTALRRRFGPEYDRALATHGDRRAAERHLADIAQRRDALDVSPLEADARAEYSARWETLQARFVDDPAGATAQADLLISEVMRSRGYPAGTFEERADLLSADHPELVGRAREGRERALGSSDRPSTAGTATGATTMNGASVERTSAEGTNTDGTNTDRTNADGTNVDGTNVDGTNVDGTRTEVLRSAFVRYRELFERLLGPDDRSDGRDDSRDDSRPRPTTVTAGATAAPRQREA